MTLDSNETKLIFTLGITVILFLQEARYLTLH